MAEFFRDLFDGVKGIGIAASEQFFGSPLFKYYSAGHIITIAVVFFLVLGAIPLFFRRKKWADKVFISFAVIDAAVMISLAIYSAITKVYNLEWFIPLHICNVFIILIPLAAIFKKKLRLFFMDFFVFGGILGCTLYTLFPMTTLLYFPPFHPASLLVTAHHIIIASLGVYLVVSGCYKKYNWFRVMSVLYVLIIGATIANPLLGTNFLFLNKAWAEPPISWFHMAFGEFAVLIIVGFFTVIALHIQLLFWVFDKIKTKTLIAICRWVLKIIDFNEIEQSRIFKRVMTTSIVKGLKDKDNFFNKLFNSVFTPEVLEFFRESRLEQLVDFDYMYTNLKRTGLLKNFLSNFSIFEAYRIRKLAALELTAETV